jgi:phenylacetic acid degradation operon negative regulatory protein
MVRQGWLSLRMAEGGGYQLTVGRCTDRPRGRTDTDRRSLDSRFDLLVLTPPHRRGERARLVATLSYLGYGCLGPGTWVAPRPAEEVDHG